jgi:hypothetical protein
MLSATKHPDQVEWDSSPAAQNNIGLPNLNFKLQQDWSNLNKTQ